MYLFHHFPIRLVMVLRFLAGMWMNETMTEEGCGNTEASAALQILWIASLHSFGVSKQAPQQIIVSTTHACVKSYSDHTLDKWSHATRTNNDNRSSRHACVDTDVALRYCCMHATIDDNCRYTATSSESIQVRWAQSVRYAYKSTIVKEQYYCMHPPVGRVNIYLGGIIVGGRWQK